MQKPFSVCSRAVNRRNEIKSVNLPLNISTPTEDQLGRSIKHALTFSEIYVPFDHSILERVIDFPPQE
jgi:hypothetical protein